MGKIILWSTLTCLFLSLVTATVITNLFFLPVMPDLVLIVVVYISFMNSSIAGSTCGFISGLLLDFLSAAPIGLNAFTKACTGFITGKFSGSFNLNRIFIPSIMVIAATLLKAALTSLLSLLFGTPILAYNPIGSLFWMEVFLNALIASPLFALLSLFPTLFIQGSRN